MLPVYYFIALLMLLLYFGLFVDHVNKCIVSVFGAFVYHFNNTISIVVTICWYFNNDRLQYFWFLITLLYLNANFLTFKSIFFNTLNMAF